MRETHRNVARTVSNVLALMDDDRISRTRRVPPNSMRGWEQEHPDLFARMLQRIKEGQIHSRRRNVGRIR